MKRDLLFGSKSNKPEELGACGTHDVISSASGLNSQTSGMLEVSNRRRGDRVEFGAEESPTNSNAITIAEQGLTDAVAV